MLNEERTIARTLEAIAVGAPDAEVIVVDGAAPIAAVTRRGRDAPCCSSRRAAWPLR